MILFIRRIIAQAIDIFLIAAIAALIPQNIPFSLVARDFCVLFLLLTKDLLFRNASIGKKITGLVVLGQNGERPPIGKMMLRNATLLLLFWFELWQLKNGEIRLGDSFCDTHVEAKTDYI